MARKPQKPIHRPSSGSMIDRVRNRFTGAQATPQVRPRRVPRYEIEARRQRMLRIGMIALAAAVVVILAGAYVWTNLIVPRQTVASVGGVNISREDYWKARAVDLWNQGAQYQQFAEMMDASMAPQYQQMAAETINKIPGVWGSTDVDPGTLGKMIDDQVYLQSLDEMGLAIAGDEVDTFLLNQFADPIAPLITPTPTPTFTPDRAAMATQTALALAATPQATPIASPEAAGSPAATPVSDLAASPVAGPVGSPAASPVATPVSATPGPEQALAIAESNLAMFERALFGEAHLTRDDYRRLVAMPALAREKIDSAITSEVGQSAEQVHAAHILVDTQDLARELVTQLANGADFAELAIQHSTDQGTAPNGGDLGWFTRDEMVAPFADAAFSLEPGQTSEPVQSEFGWHIIHAFAHETERALTDEQITRLGQAQVTKWLDERRAAIEISSSLPPTPTAVPEEFVPPVAAPPLPTATTVPQASPVASPAVSSGATPASGPVGSPLPATP